MIPSNIIENAFKNINDSSYIQLAPTQECTGRDHMEQFMQQIIDEGGEGIILRDPLSSHRHGRSEGYLKHKVYLFPHFRVL